MFDKNFLLGAATAAHQVEGWNTNSDCWYLENIPHTTYVDKSMDAVDHYNRYEEDIKLMADNGLTSYRFSLEWARIEPKEREFSEKEIEHYRDVIRCCKNHGLEPMVTLHHFSSPAWLITKGGWETESVIDNFAKYTEYVIGKLGSELNFVNTINELNIRLQLADIMKRYMMLAQKKSSADDVKKAEGSIQMGMNLKAIMENMQLSAMEGAQAFGLTDPRGVHNFQSACTEEGDLIACKAHVASREVIRKKAPHIKLGLTLSLHDFQPIEGSEEVAIREWNKEFKHYLPFVEGDDFLGLQNYTRSLIGPDGLLPSPDGAELTQAGYEYYPEGLENIIRKAAKDWKKDIYITENGIATDDDSRRVDFINTAIKGVKNCIEDGIPVKGYFYWSLMDNFEWQKGYAMKFGVIAVDRKTQKREIKESFKVLGSYSPK